MAPASGDGLLELLVYEFVTGGGCYGWPSSPLPQGALLAEGSAMLKAVVADLSGSGHCVRVMRDSRLLPCPLEADVLQVDSAECERSQLVRLAAASDGVLLIAPETGGQLRRRASWVQAAGGTLLSPSAEWIEQAGDKQHCCQRLREAGVPTADDYDESESKWPVVSKLRDGCGSQDLELLHCHEQAVAALKLGRRVEQVAWGWPVSVALLCGPQQILPLPPCEQHLDHRLHYLGGRVPLALPGWSQRAQQLACNAVEALGPTKGYVGVDLVLSDSQDVVIEVNPRLTTSYVGLTRRVSGLSEAMLEIALGSRAEVACNERIVEFAANGEYWDRSE